MRPWESVPAGRLQARGGAEFGWSALTRTMPASGAAASGLRSGVPKSGQPKFG